MKKTDEIIALLRDFKQRKSTKYGIRRIGIFGSVARGENTESSDLDICVDIEVPNPYIMCDIQDDLEKITGFKIDLLRLRDNLNSLLRHNIERDGIFV